MCLAIPGKVEAINSDGMIRVGRVNFGGVVKNVCLDYVPEVVVGDYTIVHVGFAISKIDEATAEQTLADFRALGVLDEELASEDEAFARAAKAPQSRCSRGGCFNETCACESKPGASGLVFETGANSPSPVNPASSANSANPANPAAFKP